jgi:hypothetical protein
MPAYRSTRSLDQHRAEPGPFPWDAAADEKEPHLFPDQDPESDAPRVLPKEPFI